MADQPDSVNIGLFFWVLGGAGTLIVTAFGAVRGSFNNVARQIKELWDHNDRHGTAHVRADDLGLLRNWMQGEELRKYEALEKMEARIMVEIRIMQSQIHTLTAELARIRGRYDPRPEMGDD